MWTSGKWDTTGKSWCCRRPGGGASQQSGVTALSERGQEKASELHLYMESESKTDKQNNTEDRLVDSRGEGEGAGTGKRAKGPSAWGGSVTRPAVSSLCCVCRREL